MLPCAPSSKICLLPASASWTIGKMSLMYGRSRSPYAVYSASTPCGPSWGTCWSSGRAGRDQVGAIRDDQPVDADPARLHLLHLLEQHPWVEHDAVADHARRRRVQNARGNEVEAEFLAGVDDRMSSIVAALRADHHVGLLREKVDNLALPLVAPLAAYEDGDHWLAPAPPVEIGELCLLIDEEQLELSGRPVAMLGDDDLGDIAPVLGDVVVVKALAINEEDDVAILLDRVMENDVSCNEVMQVVHRQVVNVVFAIGFVRVIPVPGIV